MRTEKLARRLFWYFAGLFTMTLGIAFSVKSNLGVSPVSTIPYTITVVWGVEMGMATIFFHIGLVVLQIILKRRSFEWKNLLQVPVGIVFGKFTTLCNWLVGFLPAVDNIAIRLVLSLLSAVFIAVGIFFYMPSDIIPLAGEGFTQAITDISHKPFHRMKTAFDVTMVTLSLITCLISVHKLGSVGVGTIIGALLVGTFLGVINKKFGAWRDEFLAVRK